MEVLTSGKRRWCRASVFILAIMTVVLPARFTAQEQDEYAVKAAFIVNLSKFVEWPQTSIPDTFDICILGDDPFEALIDQFTHGKSASGHSIQVRRLKETAEAKTCQIVFAGSAERAKATKLVDAVRGTPVLTVGEKEDFLRIGGMVVLTMEGSHVTITINASSASNANLKISAKLLTLAKIYKTN